MRFLDFGFNYFIDLKNTPVVVGPRGSMLSSGCNSPKKNPGLVRLSLQRTTRGWAFEKGPQTIVVFLLGCNLYLLLRRTYTTPIVFGLISRTHRRVSTWLLHILFGNIKIFTSTFWQLHWGVNRGESLSCLQGCIIANKKQVNMMYIHMCVCVYIYIYKYTYIYIRMYM